MKQLNNKPRICLEQGCEKQAKSKVYRCTKHHKIFMQRYRDRNRYFRYKPGEYQLTKGQQAAVRMIQERCRLVGSVYYG